MNKVKIKKLLDQVDSLEKKKSLGLQDEITNLTDKLKENFAVKALRAIERISAEVEKFKVDFNLAPLLKAINQLEQEVMTSEAQLRGEFEAQIKLLPRIPDLTVEVENLWNEVQQKFDDLKVDDLKLDIENLKSQFQTYVETGVEEEKIETEELDKKLLKLRLEMNNRLSNLGGGAMNRQMFIGGADPLTKYTDMNIKAGSNVTITYANNNTTKQVDVTISSSGGGGGGTVRSINSISADTTAGATAGTDYVYLVSGTTTITLPTAVGNTNLYTIKNVGTGVVTIATTSAQTIDGTTTITMPVQYTAVDTISDTANWNIT